MKKNEDIIRSEHLSSGLKSISNQIEPVIEKLLGAHALIQIDILKEWKQIVGEELFEHTRPERIDFKKGERDNGTLVLAVSSGAFAVEAQHKTPLILEKINTYFGYKAVSKIKIFQNESSFLMKEEPNSEDKKKKKLVTKDKQTYIDNMLSDIENPDLKKNLASIALEILKNNKES